MPTTAGSIVVDLLARTGSFDTDIDRSTKATEKRVKEMQKKIEAAGTAIGLAMAGAGVAAVAFAKNTIEGLDALNDVADATGASIENISALEDVALRTGNSFESVTGALVKFNQGLKDTDPENKTAAILEKIGLDADRLRQMDPAEALHQVARALATFADDGDKARVVQELFGKSVREVAPLLKDLAEQEQLHATVTTDEAKAAEEFNKQLADMHKNSTDLARSIASDLLPEVNALLKAFREGGSLGGIMAMGAQMIGVGGGDPAEQLNVVSDKLGTMKRQLAELQALPNGVRSINEAIFGDEADLARQIKALEAEKRFLQSLQQTAALAGAGDVSDAVSRRIGDRPGIGPVPSKPKKGPKGPDPDADFKSYLSNLQQQLQKVDQLTVSEKLLDDLRRGSLTVTPAQEKQLKTLAATVDKQKEDVEIRKMQRQAVMDEVDALTKSNDAYQEQLKALLDQGPAAQLEKQRAEMQLLADAYQRGAITVEQFKDAATGALHLVAEPAEHFNLQLSQTQEALLEIGADGARAFQDLALHGASFGDVLKRLLLNVADLIFQLGVVQPLMRELRQGIGGGVMPPNPFAEFSLKSVGSSISSFLGFADGGDPPVGRASIVGERGPELFIPRTAGTIIPNEALGGGDGHTTIVNQTTGRVDDVVERRVSPRDRVLILQEARRMVAADLHDANSPISRALGGNYALTRNRR